MHRLLLIALISTACRPEPVLDPTKHRHHAGVDEVQRDVSASKAPDGTVTALDGTPFDIATLWDRRRVVLVFYMGHWCPACQKQLAEYNAKAAAFEKEDATIVAVSTDSPEDAAALKEKLGLSYDLYVDPQLQMITKWGVNDSSQNIARPSTFIIQTGGQITFRKVGGGNADRPTADELLAELGKG